MKTLIQQDFEIQPTNKEQNKKTCWFIIRRILSTAFFNSEGRTI